VSERTDAPSHEPAPKRRTSWGAYARIADALRERLAAGDPRPGELLPSEAALCKEYSVARNTVPRALATLESEGLIEALPGRGRVARAPSAAADSGNTPPQYRKIAAILRADIAAGTLRPGDALPSEATLTERYGVARGTARQALAELEGAGLIESVHGKGRYVRQAPAAPAE
jgi:DNA-binding GntR family transcriptional regulator